MINIIASGRLGNQMFQYAFARAFQEENRDKGSIVIVPLHASHDQYGGLTILDFNVGIYDIVEKPHISQIQKAVWLLFRLLRTFCSCAKGKNAARECTIRLQPILNRYGLYAGFLSENLKLHYNSIFDNVLLNGNWENPVYFNRINSILKRELTPKHAVLAHNEKLLEEILSTNSVCVSVRRGDFLKNGNESFNVCTEDYFYEAERIIAQRLNVYKLFVFSDDVEWCQQNLHFQGSVSFEKNNGRDPVWEKMRLMSACKHFIISNSTFSWWAQYLSNHTNKIVIAPRPWRKNEYCDCLYDDSFILLNSASGKWERVEISG